MIDASQITKLIGFFSSLKRELSVQRIDDNPIQIHDYPQKITLYVNAVIIAVTVIQVKRIAQGDSLSFSYAYHARNTRAAYTPAQVKANPKKSMLIYFSFLSWTSNIIPNKKNSVTRNLTSQFLHKCGRPKLWRFCEEPP